MNEPFPEEPAVLPTLPHETIDDSIPEKPVEPVAEVEVKPSVPERKPQNVYLDGPVTSTLLDEQKDDRGIELPSDSDERVTEILKNTPNVNMTGTAQGAKWAGVVREAIGMSPDNNVFVETLEDSTAEFRQDVEINGGKFGPNMLKFKERQNSVFDGEIAVLRTISHLGLGDVWNTPLYNSGFWVTMKPPAEDDLVELYRQLTSDAIDLGRYSYGLVYANTTAYTVARMCHFAMQQVYRIGTHPDQITAANALEHIKVQDIGALLWGLACTMFPKGFAYERACTADPEKCQHVVKETLNLRKLQVVNTRALTDRNKVMLSENRSAQKLTIKDIESYQADLTRAIGRRVVINEGKSDEIAFNLRSPSIAEYIQTGHRWIGDMVETADKALGSTATTEERNTLVEQRARASIMRQYSHWVDSIELESNVIKDRASIEKVLNNISGDRKVRVEFTKQVTKFIDFSSVSVVGIPAFTCPKCGKPNESHQDGPFKTSMIPLDVIQLFFVLITQKHRDMAKR